MKIEKKQKTEKSGPKNRDFDKNGSKMTKNRKNRPRKYGTLTPLLTFEMPLDTSKMHLRPVLDSACYRHPTFIP
jgi:hypothetical protein